MTRLVIRGGTVVDGTGAPGRHADVVVDDDRIAAIMGAGRASIHDARRVIDATDLVVAPGFIDLHSHADFTLPAYPDALSSLAQGVTTEVIGNCGFSPAPLAAADAFAEATRAACRGLGPALDWRWHSFGEYLDRLDGARPAVNCVPLVGHGAIRHAVMGADDRAATDVELATMREVLATALDDGVWGMSTGLVYPPGSFAAPDEVLRLAEPLRSVDGLYASHIRNEGDELVTALDEAVDVGRRVGVRVHVSHLKAAGLANHGRIPRALEQLDAARAAGVAVTHDVYPYTAASTMLSQVVPPWAHDGGTAALVERLRSDTVRRRIAMEIDSGLPGWPNYVRSSGGWSSIHIAAVADPALRHLEGRRVDEAARDAGVLPLELVLDTLVTDRAATVMVMFMMNQADVDAALLHPSSVVGSDQLGVTSPTARVHPRSYGSFVRVLGEMVRDRGLLDLPTAVARMTGMPARILRLADRGRVAVGAVADLVVFDPRTVADGATYAEPTRLPAGIEAVLVAGRLAMWRGEALDARAGRVLRRSR